MSKILCIYHGNCADGFGAAWAVHKALGDTVEFHPGFHGKEPPDIAGRRVLMVDFSYKRPVLEAMIAVADTLTVIDHHKTAEADLAGLNNWRPGVKTIFDMGRSGAGLAWDYFHPAEPRPPLIDYIEDRDLWRFKLPFSREVNAYIFAHEYTFRDWDCLAALMKDHMGIQDAADRGGAIEKKHHKDIAELLAVTKRTMTIGGYAVPVASLPYTLSSDAGNVMAEGERFAACYWDTPTHRVFSLRSRPEGMDVSEIAKAFGGGGHKNAAGFQVPRDHDLARQ